MIDDTRMYNEPRDNGVAKITAGFVVGALVGAGVALLMAPSSGRETRQRLGDAANRLGNVAKDGLHQARQAVGGLKEDASAAIDAGKEAVRQRRSMTDSPINTINT